MSPRLLRAQRKNLKRRMHLRNRPWWGWFRVPPLVATRTSLLAVIFVELRKVSVSAKRKRLLHQITELVECSARLRDHLQRYERAMGKIAKRLEDGASAVTAAKGIGIPTERRQVTEAIEEFEAARHQLRLALFALGKEEGASMSEVGRVLGISRQLASRLAGEAASADP